jgi:hypothetical protein
MSGSLQDLSSGLPDVVALDTDEPEGVDGDLRDSGSGVIDGEGGEHTDSAGGNGVSPDDVITEESFTCNPSNVI